MLICTSSSSASGKTATVTADDLASFQVAGPATVSSAVCSAAYTISQTDQYANPAVESTNTVVTVTGQGSGNFYTAPDCSGVAVSSATILAGSSSNALIQLDADPSMRGFGHRVAESVFEKKHTIFLRERMGPDLEYHR